MTEIEKIQYTKAFVDKIVDGINPLDNTRIDDADLLHHPRMIGCMGYISHLLQVMIDQEKASTELTEKIPAEEDEPIFVEQMKSCKECMSYRHGECLGKANICEDYKYAPYMNDEKRKNWPFRMSGPYGKSK